MRWAGFRKVRRQVCRRVARRLAALGLTDAAAYREHLEGHPDEWVELDAMCRITISRFYRDRGTFDRLRDDVLPQLAAEAQAREESELCAWSVGCASGEEAYTLRILWRLAVAERFPELSFRIVATDMDEMMLERARAADFSTSSLRELPAAWRETAFEPAGSTWILKEAFREVDFRRQDVRRQIPDGPFHVITCRNLIFTYYDEDTQRQIVERLAARLTPGGALVIGCHEKLPEGARGFESWPAHVSAESPGSSGVWRAAEPTGSDDDGSGSS
jgi:chemotaxis protein methyltransferase CheR